MDLGRYLRCAREAIGKTQGAIAKELEKSSQLISQWERNERKPPIKDIYRVAMAYGLSVGGLQEVLKGVEKNREVDGVFDRLRNGITTLPVGIAEFGGFFHSLAKGRNKPGYCDDFSFFERLAHRLVGMIDTRLHIEEVAVCGMQKMISGLAGASPRFALALGLFKTNWRTPRGIEFVSIPGWKVRLACLASSQSDLTWVEVCQGPERTPGLHALTFAADIGNTFLQWQWGNRACDHAITALEHGDLEGICTQFRDRVAIDPKCVVVIDEYTAARVARKIQQDGHGLMQDLAATGSVAAPSCDLSIATPESDPDWTAAVRDIVHGHLLRDDPEMPRLYADCLLTLLAEGRPEWVGELLPSYMKVTSITASTAPDFLANLRRELATGLKDLGYDRDKAKLILADMVPTVDEQGEFRATLDAIAVLAMRLPADLRVGLQPWLKSACLISGFEDEAISRISAALARGLK